LAAFSRHPEALAWGRGRAELEWGRIALTSDAFQFDETDYYQPTMGPGLLKQFWAFENLVDPGGLADFKIKTNDWENACVKLEGYSDPRPLNLDPGYMTPAKVVLASTKDHAHRIYLGRGIYAEVTLYYHDRQWRHREWTFPDYRREDYRAFFQRCRDYLRTHPDGRSTPQESPA
jgi:hypothetical protein